MNSAMANWKVWFHPICALRQEKGHQSQTNVPVYISTQNHCGAQQKFLVVPMQNASL